MAFMPESIGMPGSFSFSGEIKAVCEVVDALNECSLPTPKAFACVYQRHHET
jgi:hypothetical protein